jgi:hypothetical protein
LSLYAPLRHAGGVELQLHSVLTSALYEGEWMVSFTSRPLYPRGRIPVLIEQEAVWASHADWTLSGRENSLVLTGVPTLDCPARSIVAVPNTLWNITLYSGSFWILVVTFSSRRSRCLVPIWNHFWGDYCRWTLMARTERLRLYSA